MKIKPHIKSIFIFLLTFLLGAQTTYAKTKVILPQNEVVILVEQNQNAITLEKVVQPNIGFLKEKTKFVVVQGVSAQNCCNFSEGVVGGLANAGGKVFDPVAFANYIDDIPTKSAFGSPTAPARIYQENVAGVLEYQIKNSDNVKIWADGVDLLNKLNLDLISKTNGPEIRALIKENPNDLTTIYKDLKDHPGYAHDMAKNGNYPRWVKWGKSNFFKTVTKKGKDFEEFVVNNISTLRTKILAEYSTIDINQYEIFTQVQIKTGVGNEYFVADMVLVRKIDDGFGQIFLDKNNVIVIETKLSSSTNLTTHQTNATPLLNQLDNSIGTRNVLTHLEDAQGRLVTVIERPGQSNLVSVIHKDVNGTYKLTEFSPGYNPSLNPSIPAPLSANKLVPDFSTTQYMHPLNQGQTIKIKMSGKRNGTTGDFALANAEMKKINPSFVKPQNYTWHHLDDFNPATGECTMQLVESTAHQGAGVTGMQHSGSVAQWKAYYGASSDAPNNLFYQN